MNTRNATPVQVLVTREHDVATVMLSNPAKRNALTESMWKTIASTFRALAREPLRAVLVCGDGGHFAAGADIGEFPKIRMSRIDAMRYHMQTVAHALSAIEECPHVTVAAIEGSCVGGGLEIALACDLRIARQGAVFGIPAGRLGFPLAPTELRLLLDTVNRTVAAELLLECRTYDSRRAVETGLITRECTDLQAEVLATIERLRTGSIDAAREHKQWLRRLGADRSGRGPQLQSEELLRSMDFAERPEYRNRVNGFLERG